MLCRYDTYYMCVDIVCILTQSNDLFKRKSSKKFIMTLWTNFSEKDPNFEKRFVLFYPVFTSFSN